MRLRGSQKDQQTTEQVDTQGVKYQIDQEEGQSDPDPSKLVVSFGSILGKASISEINLIPFMPTEGEEVPNFNTSFMTKKRKESLK